MIEKKQLQKQTSPTTLIRAAYYQDRNAYMDHCATLTVAKAMKGEQMSSIKKKAGKEVAHQMVAFILQELNDSLGEKKQMNKKQLLDAAYRIMSKYWYLKIEELSLICERAREGFYGDAWMDETFLGQCIAEYDKEKMTVINKNHDDFSAENRSNREDLSLEGIVSGKNITSREKMRQYFQRAGAKYIKDGAQESQATQGKAKEQEKPNIQNKE